MADSLVFKGAKSVTKHSGTEMRLSRPKRGGDTHQVRQWWGLKNRTLYINAAVFIVSSTVGELRLVIPVDTETTELRIRHDGAGNFTFPYTRAVDRVAVYSGDKATFYKEYQFSKISGGSMVTRTVNTYPTPVESKQFTGSTTIAGDTTVGSDLTATAATFTGGVGSVSTVLLFEVSDNGTSGWTTLAENTGVGSGGTATYTVTGAEDTKFIRAKYSVTDDEGFIEDTSTSTGPVTQTFAVRAAAATNTYAVTVVDDGHGNDVFALDGDAQKSVSLSVGESVAFDYSAVNPAHPVALFTDANKGTPVTVGVEDSNGTLLFTPVIPASLSYQCINHSGMGGDITVS
jgi:hypothetical protein